MLRPVTIRCRVIFDGEITAKDIDAVVESLRINNFPRVGPALSGVL